MVENDLLVPDEDYSGEEALFKLNYHELDSEAYAKKIEEVMQLPTDKLNPLFFYFHDLYEQRQRIIKEGYRNMVHHIENDQLEDVYPYYFTAPLKHHNKDKTTPYQTLFDYKDKVVFVGLTATGLNALNPTPYTQRYTMAALAPTAMNTILTESFLYEKTEWEPFLIFLYSVLVFIIIFYLPAIISHPLCIALAVGHGFGVLHLMNDYGYIIAFIFPILSAMVSHLAGNFYLYWEQLQERKKVRGMFSAMVSPEVLKIMEEDPDKFNLQGEKVEASMFSSDVSGFTSISEGVTAQELALILNLYLTPMSDLVMTYGGYVEKYEGDAIKADFGMPMPDNDHAWKACFSALLQQEELTVVQRMLQLKYGVMITARMGVNTGVVNAGNMGSVNKMQYCAIGEEVAMAEELEPSNKMWETWIAISPETLRLSGDKVKIRMLDVVDYEYVTIPVYELLGWDQQAFLDFWAGKPIPKLVIEGWGKIIPEKILAYINYYSEHKYEGNAFYDLLMGSFKSLEQTCIDYVKVSDKLNLHDLEQRYLALIAEVDQMEVKVSYEDLDIVDQTEWQGLEKAVNNASEEWLILLNKYLFELKKRTHVVNRMTGKRDQNELDELHTAIDTLEKKCNCYIKRNRFPTEDDVYGNTFKDHLMATIPNPNQGLDQAKIEQYQADQNRLDQEVKQIMATFIEKAKPLAEDYHKMMSEHCLLQEDKQKVCEIFGEGRELYLKREWDKAIAKFDEGLALVDDDGPCIKYTERCENFKKNPPEKDWKGVWEADW
jgi:class 3 adenylate cyclase